MRRALGVESGHYEVLYPAIAETARRVGAEAVALIDVGRSAGLNLNVDRVGIEYLGGPYLGFRTSLVQRSCKIAKASPVPSTELPEVAARVVIDRNPLDVTQPDDVRGLAATAPADQMERRAMLHAEISLAAAEPRLLLAGDANELLPEAIDLVPRGVVPVVLTTWTLARYKPQDRTKFLERLEEAAVRRPIAWVAAEGVGVAPLIPTLGDRPASGHSIIGLALFDGSRWHAEALGRCWSKGGFVEWLAGD